MNIFGNATLVIEVIDRMATLSTRLTCPCSICPFDKPIVCVEAAIQRNVHGTWKAGIAAVERIVEVPW